MLILVHGVRPCRLRQSNSSVHLRLQLGLLRQPHGFLECDLLLRVEHGRHGRVPAHGRRSAPHVRVQRRRPLQRGHGAECRRVGQLRGGVVGDLGPLGRREHGRHGRFRWRGRRAGRWRRSPLLCRLLCLCLLHLCRRLHLLHLLRVLRQLHRSGHACHLRYPRHFRNLGHFPHFLELQLAQLLLFRLCLFHQLPQRPLLVLHELCLPFHPLLVCNFLGMSLLHVVSLHPRVLDLLLS
mmetsp:Transcript_40744/g.95191  ORF Transcript_40744/g.95191 Transcript_40744/m.95191 type:complete len:238 (-) Transcript_40744:365-1078(-)